jgi:ribonuclease R
MDELKKRIINYINDDKYIPLKPTELAVKLGIESHQINDFFKLIDDLKSEMYLILTKKDRIIPPNQAGLFVGKFISHRKGFGFVESDKEDERDLYIPMKDVGDAMHGDRVLAEITREASGYKRAEGKIVEVITRTVTQIVGTFKPHEHFGFVVPREKSLRTDVYIQEKYFNGAKEDDVVVVEILQWAKDDKKPEGKIVEVLGNKDNRGIEIESIIREHGLPLEFQQKVLDNANYVAVPIPEEEYERRRDLRDKHIFTMDGADAKDLDDAIQVEMLANGNYLLGVHIADVTHYVKEKSELDKEALKRATSVYLVDKVIPMLPKQLSNGVCSLNPNEDKLTLSVFMEINDKGDVVYSTIEETIIKSKARMVYTDVSDILENNDRGLKIKYAELVDDFRLAEKLAKILMKKREKRGALDFNFPEPYIHLDENGKPYSIEPYERRIANKIIEEFMLVTNETVAEYFYWLGIPFVYRIHETPSSTKMEALNSFINQFNILIKGDLEEVHPKALQKIIKEMEGKPGEKAINTLLLRSLKQAKYSPDCSGHFGLAASYYCHFTSPIRRYPDLQIHRIIKEFINGGINNRRQDKLKDIVLKASEQSSEMERKAEVAERDIDKFYKCIYMEDKIGEEFEGIISSVTNYGFYVELPDTVEGLVPIECIEGDSYIYNEKNHELIGQGYSNEVHIISYKIGDKVNIKVEHVNAETREITFKLV